MRQSNCQFVVNEKKRVITCIYHCDSDVVVDYIESKNHIFAPTLFLQIFSKAILKLRMPTTWIGIARCSNEDEWNEELGKTIAFRRMKNKYYKEFFRKLNRWIHMLDEELDTFINEANMFGMRVEAAMDRLDDTIANNISENMKG